MKPCAGIHLEALFEASFGGCQYFARTFPMASVVWELIGEVDCLLRLF